MSAKLFFSNSPAVLLDKLSQNLEWDDPFRPPHIATPTPAMKRWVQMRLAEKRGIVANVDFLPLERTLWKRLEELDQEHVVAFRKPARLLDEQGLQLLILGMLRRHPPPEVRAYLEEEGEAREAVAARRVCQLSLKLAGLFREYEYSRVHEPGREGLAYLWKHGRDCFAGYMRKKDAAGSGEASEARDQVARLERWQKAVYHALFRPGGLRDRLGESTGQYSYTLPQYAEMVLAQARDPAGPGAPAPTYHLFGLSQVSPFHQSLIRRLSDADSLQGRQAGFCIYSLNPCGEYWEDAPSARERRRLMQEDLFQRQRYVSWRQLEAGEKARLLKELEAAQAEELHLAEDNPLLGQWGGPGRDNIRLWSRYLDYGMFDHFQENVSASLLGAVQESLLKRMGRLPPEERRAQDGSLRILACPEIHREVETVRDGIVEDLLRDPSLRPDEVAVLVPDMEKYRHVLAAVFGRTTAGEGGHVPYSLAGGSAASESEYARGVRGLFDLATGRFSRKEVFALAANPCFRAAQGLDEEALRAWLRWSAGLNIFHGFDGEDKRRRGYGGEPAHTWAQGLDRLILGTVMESPLDGDVRHFDGVIPFADGFSPDRELLVSFVQVIEGLHRGLAPLRGGPRPWSEWVDLILALLDAYLGLPEDEAEAYVRTELRRYLLELRGMDALEELLEADGRIGADIVMDLVLDRLSGFKAGRDAVFGGVQIASLQALRSLPFRVIYILGLGEGEFPEDSATSTLDLRQYRRIIGDVDPSARNRYLFLEALVCAGEKLCLSYVSRDVRQGKVFQMSSVLHELTDYLEDAVLPEGENFRSVQAPLLGRAPVLFEPEGKAWDPPRNFSREERLLAWLESRKGAWESAGLEKLRAAMPERLRREVFPPAPESDAPAPEAIPAAVSVPLRDLAGYLKNPVEYTLYHQLGVNDWREEDAAALEDEPFFSGKAQERALLERVFATRLENWEDAGVEAARRDFDAYYQALARRGFMPEGHYQTLDRELLWQGAEEALGAMDGARNLIQEAGAARCLLNVALGETPRRVMAGADLAFPPVRLAAEGGRQVEIHGHLPCLFLLPDGSCATLVALPHDMRLNRLISPFLFYLAGLLSDSRLGEWLRGGPFTVYYLHRQGDSFIVRKWPPFSVAPEEARAYVQALLGPMLSGADFDHLPFDLVIDSLIERKGGNKWEGSLVQGVDYAQVLREALEEQEPGDRFAAYKIKESVKILGPRVPDDANAKVQGRLGVFFNWK